MVFYRLLSRLRQGVYGGLGVLGDWEGVSDGGGGGGLNLNINTLENE